jgi:hypothetical protein
LRKRIPVRNATNRRVLSLFAHGTRLALWDVMNNSDCAPESVREIDDAALAEQLSRLAAVFDLNYDDLVAALGNGGK